MKADHGDLFMSDNDYKRYLPPKGGGVVKSDSDRRTKTNRMRSATAVRMKTSFSMIGQAKR